MKQGRPRIRTPEYWKEYRRRQRQQHREEVLAEALRVEEIGTRYRLTEGCAICGYRQNAAAIHDHPHKGGPGWWFLCDNCWSASKRPDLDASNFPDLTDKAATNGGLVSATIGTDVLGIV